MTFPPAGQHNHAAETARAERPAWRPWSSAVCGLRGHRPAWLPAIVPNPYATDSRQLGCARCGRFLASADVPLFGEHASSGSPVASVEAGQTEAETLRALDAMTAAVSVEARAREAAEARLAETERQRDEAVAAWDAVANAIENGEPLFQILRRRTEAAEASAARAEEALSAIATSDVLCAQVDGTEDGVDCQTAHAEGELDAALPEDWCEGCYFQFLARAALSAGAEGTAG